MRRLLILLLLKEAFEVTRLQSSTEKQLQQGFKYFNRLMLALWRLGLGPWVNALPSIGGRIMVLTHTGRRSGRPRHTPVNYAIVGDDIYCTAGFGETSDWYRNIIANPSVEVWLPDGWWAGIAEEMVDPDIRLAILHKVLVASGFAAYAAGLDPRKMTDQELDAATKHYRLICIRRTTARTGPDGPGSLAWVWPLATMILIPLAFRRKK